MVKRVAEILCSNLGSWYPTVEAAFLAECTTSIDFYVRGDILGEAEYIARRAAGSVPCCACNGDTMEHPYVGWCSIILEDSDEQPTLVKGFRLCAPCTERAIVEEMDQPPPPYIQKLTRVWHDGDRRIAANWGVFSKALG